MYSRSNYLAASGLALLAVAAFALTGCGTQTQMRAPHVRSVSADVYGSGDRSVTSDVYSPNEWNRQW